MKKYLIDFPLLRNLIHPKLNKNIDIAQLTCGSEKKIWWVCSLNHEWQAPVCQIAKHPSCPYCTNRKVLTGFNDLKTLKPEFAAQWHPTQNGNLTPEQVTAGSTKKVWWSGACGHEWDASVVDRTRQDGKCTKCPYCAGKRVLHGFNSLTTTHPSIAAQWHPTKNGNLTPNKITSGSNKKVWWLGDCGHEWEAAICDRTRQDHKQTNCSYCAGKKVLQKFNSLTVTHPSIATQWHPTLNGLLTPDNVTESSSKRVWWQCGKNHEWEVAIADRTHHKTFCPICVGQKVGVGFNDLLSVNPTIASEWHPTLNAHLTSEQVTSGSNKKVWWQCKENHEWQATIHDRARQDGRNIGCLKCSLTNNSKMENSLFEYIQTIQHDAVQKDRAILGKQELDVYVPEKKIAIEFNGLYWHSERTKPKSYHYDKWLACKNKGIQLIQIWEDDWVRNSEQVKVMLAHKLGASQERKVYARKTEVQVVSKIEAEQFLNQNHIQGYASGSYYLGLVEKGDIENILVAVLVLKKEAGTEGKTLNIIRYATSVNVVGGFTKLLAYSERTYMPEKFITFSDNCVSDGGLYLNNGFTAEKELAADYTYVVHRVRCHKFGYRLKRFQDDPELQYIEGLTERELALLNGFPRIWDAGKTRWIKEMRYT